MPDFRIDCCPACEGEGRIHCEEFWNWDADTGEPVGASWDEPCDLCEGTGGVLIEVWPVECDDLTALVPA